MRNDWRKPSPTTSITVILIHFHRWNPMAPKPKTTPSQPPAPPPLEDLFTTLNKHIQASAFTNAVKLTDQSSLILNLLLISINWLIIFIIELTISLSHRSSRNCTCRWRRAPMQDRCVNQRWSIWWCCFCNSIFSDSSWGFSFL